MVNKYFRISKKRILEFIVFSFLLFLIPHFSYCLRNVSSLKKERVFFIPSSQSLKFLSGGFKSFCADIFYIRGILAVSDKIKVKDHNFWINWVQGNFGAAVFLDPKLIQSYFFAGVVITGDKESIKKGIEFLQKYSKYNPDEWRIWYWIGFNYYQLGDYLKAAWYYQKASVLPGAKQFLKDVQPMLYYKAGRPQLGLSYLNGLLHSINDPRQKELAKTKIKWLKDIIFLQEEVEKFKQIYGRLPAGLEELVKYRLISGIPQDPFGRGYYLDKESGRVKSRFGPTKKEISKGKCSLCR
jgi:tetratricopeptide (TPR) repeat protein